MSESNLVNYMIKPLNKRLVANKLRGMGLYLEPKTKMMVALPM